MLPENGIRRGKKKYHYYITDDEVRAFLADVDKNCTEKWQLITHLALFTGLRANEICYLNIADFPGWKTLDFNKVNVRVCKTGDEEERYIIPHVAAMIRDYVILYDGRFAGGYLFPSYWQTRFKRPVLSTETIGAWFAKCRNRLKKTHAGFNEYYESVGFYRIHFHVFRHWFQTKITQIEKDPYFLRQLLSYRDLNSVLSYVRVENFSEKAPKVLEQSFNHIFEQMKSIGPGQTTLKEY